ncbi:MAG: hypothetical protein RR054_05890 [Clostridia bacterium]
MSNDSSYVTNNQTCPAVGYQSASICVPVTITPFAQTGATVTKCCGAAIVTSGRTPCEGVKNGVCSFTISQNICVAVPVAFGAVATVGDTFVNCNGASADDICTDCIPVPTHQTTDPKTESVMAANA